MNALDLAAQKVERRGALTLDKTPGCCDGHRGIFVVEAFKIREFLKAGLFGGISTGGDMEPPEIAPAFIAANSSGIPPIWTMVTSFSGSRPNLRNIFSPPDR